MGSTSKEREKRKEKRRWGRRKEGRGKAKLHKYFGVELPRGPTVACS